MRIVGLLCVVLILSGCGLRERFFGGGGGQASATLPFRAQLSRGDDRRDISVRVSAEGASLDDVRESVRFQATRYCVTNYGRSDTKWAIDPATNDWAFVRAGGDMIFTGRCLAR
ncbi:MAG: hypothetical protein OXQ92_07125 [Boseongicola sp.]|nr:hypothetical protein [Boseongicola sp.]